MNRQKGCEIKTEVGVKDWSIKMKEKIYYTIKAKKEKDLKQHYVTSWHYLKYLDVLGQSPHLFGWHIV